MEIYMPQINPVCCAAEPCFAAHVKLKTGAIAQFAWPCQVICKGQTTAWQGHSIRQLLPKVLEL